MSASASTAPSIPDKKTKKKKPVRDWPIFRRLFREFLRPHVWWLIGSIIAFVVVSGASTAIAWVIKPTVDTLVAASTMDLSGHMTKLYALAGLIVGIFCVRALANYASEMFMAYAGSRIVRDIQGRLYKKIFSMDLGYFQANKSVAMSGMVCGLGENIRTLLSEAMMSIGRDGLTLIGLVGWTFFLNWKLALIAYFVLPIAVMPVIFLGRQIRKRQGKLMSQGLEYQVKLSETIRGIRMVKLYGAESITRQRVRDLLIKIRNLTLRLTRMQSAVSPLMELFIGIAIGLVIYFGGLQVMNHETIGTAAAGAQTIADSFLGQIIKIQAPAGEMTAGELASFIFAIIAAYRPAKSLANLHVSLQSAFFVAGILCGMLDMKAKSSDKPNAPPLPKGPGDLRFENVTFSYDVTETSGYGFDLEEKGEDQKGEGLSKRPPALRQVSFNVKPGQIVAFVGSSGSGKSTIVNLIGRFFDPLSGKILIDGVDITEASAASVRERIALVTQDVTIFDDTVRANIAYGQPDASDEDIIRAAKLAAADEFITKMPEGYQTWLGERGIRLSGGQRQRLSIARAFLRNAPIILLDEPTSALDGEAERTVQNALEQLMKGRSCLVVAHRLSTITNADQICVIQNGQIVERGTHADLLAQNGVYARLYEIDQQGA